MIDFWKDKKVLVTGHTGFKGSWLSSILLIAGAEVSGFALAEPEGELFDRLGLSDRMHSYIGDIRDYDSLLECLQNQQPEIIFHMAAQPLVYDGYERPKYTYDVNVMGTVNILEAVRNIDSVRTIINITTDKVYENVEKNVGYVESDILNGHDPYANSKSCSELVTSCYDKSFLKEKGIKVITARSGNVIGGGDFSENRLIPDCYRATSIGEAIGVRNPNAIRPYQHVLETLGAYLVIAERGISSCYNIAPDKSDIRNNSQLVDSFCSAWGDGAKWELISANFPHETNILMLDNSKIKAELDWKPKWGVEEAVRQTVLWYKGDRTLDEQIKEYFTND